jgi:hypothetical protein
MISRETIRSEFALSGQALSSVTAILIYSFVQCGDRFASGIGFEPLFVPPGNGCADIRHTGESTVLHAIRR